MRRIRDRPPGHRTGKDGFALVLVLWTLLLLSLLGLSLTREAMATRREADARISALRARLVADGGIARALASLVDPSDPDRWKLDGTPRSVALHGAAIAVSVEGEAGKFDLNAMPPAAIAALLAAKGCDPARAARLAERIVAWRTPLPAIPGPDSVAAGDAAYKPAHRSYLPRHAPFWSVAELRLVLGMDDDLQAALAPVLTVHSGNPGVDRAIATDAVLALLADSDELARDQRRARAAGNDAGADRPAHAGEVVTIRARVAAAGIDRERVALIRIGGDRRTPYQVLAWR